MGRYEVGSGRYPRGSNILTYPAGMRLVAFSPMSMRICLLTNQDLDSPTISKDDWPCDPRPFMPEASWHLVVLGDKVASVDQVEQGFDCRRHGREAFDVFFNLCDGAADQLDLPGTVLVVEVIHERLGESRRTGGLRVQ